MSTAGLDGLLRMFRRHLALIQGLRFMMLAAFAAALMWTLTGQHRPGPAGGGADGPGGAGVVGRVLRALDVGGEGDAGQQLADCLRTSRRRRGPAGSDLAAVFAVARGQYMLLQQLAGLLFRRERYREVVAICSELLRHRLGQFRGLMLNTRIMLADCLLLLDRADKAYAAMRRCMMPR